LLSSILASGFLSKALISGIKDYRVRDEKERYCCLRCGSNSLFPTNTALK
jgi:hypothetical protein